MKLTELLDQIQQLDQQATPGPWVSDKSHLYDYVEPHPYDLYEAAEDDPPLASDILPRDGEFIALARTALPQLAAVIRRLRECAQTLTEDNNDASDYASGIHEAVECLEHIIKDALGDDDA